MLETGNYDSSSSLAAECYGSISSSSLNSAIFQKNNKRRFSDDQIKSLETIFESETKLEPRKKLQVAKELGLHPRQVAIWFQNKRARRKSKQLERDFGVLRSNYNDLASQFESLKKDKKSLLSQLQELNELIGKCEKKELGQCYREEEVSGSCTDNRGSDDIKGSETKNEIDDCCIRTYKLGLDQEDDREILSIMEPADSSLTSPEEWGSFESEGLGLDKPTTSYQLWDFWS